VGPLDATEGLMLNMRIKMIQEVNKTALETEKERDSLHNPLK
jgi:hypothetical protein